MQKNTMHPAYRLQTLRLALGLSQRELAKEFMVSSGAIASWELGANPIPGPVLRLIELYENSLSGGGDNEKNTPHFDEVLHSIDLLEHEKEKISLVLKQYVDDETNINSLRAKSKLALSKQILGLLKDSKGMTIKLVQLLSYLEVGLPAEVRNVFGNIQSNLKPLNKNVVISILEKNLGGKVEEVFSSFEMKPFAVTSLAQVHYGKLKNGSEVAVKIQDPEIRHTLQKQFSKLDFFMKLGGVLNKDVVDLGNEIKRSIEVECDYLQEVENQLKIKAILKNMPRVYVPHVYRDLCSPNVIVSEFIDGENFRSFASRANQESKNLVAEAVVRSLTHLAFSHYLVYADAHFENFLVKNDKIVILDFGRIFVPNNERMRIETMFYRAFLKGQKEIAKSLFWKIDFVKDRNNFDFEEFWMFLSNTSKHLLVNGSFRFDKDYLNYISREGRRFSQKKNMKLSPEVFWAFAFSSGTWAIFAELEAEINWNKIATETFDVALGFS